MAGLCPVAGTEVDGTRIKDWGSVFQQGSSRNGRCNRQSIVTFLPRAERLRTLSYRLTLLRAGFCRFLTIWRQTPDGPLVRCEPKAANRLIDRPEMRGLKGRLGQLDEGRPGERTSAMSRLASGSSAGIERAKGTHCEIIEKDRVFRCLVLQH